MKQSLARKTGDPTVYVTDWKTKRPLFSEDERDALIYIGVVKTDYPADATVDPGTHVIVVGTALPDRTKPESATNVRYNILDKIPTEVLT